MQRKLNKKQIDCLMIIGITLLIIIGIGLAFVSKHNEKKSDSLTRLTEQYNDSLNTTNDVQGSEFVANDKNSNAINSSNAEKESVNKNKDDDEKNVLKKKADQVISNIVSCINKDNYSEFYQMLNKEYIKDFEVNEEKIKQNYTFKGDISYEITNVKETNTGMVATTKITEKSTGYIRLVDFTIFKDNTISDIEISNIVDMDKDIEIDNIRYTISRQYVIRLASVYVVNIDNKSNKELDIQGFNINSGGKWLIPEVINRSVLKVTQNRSDTLLIKTPNVDHIENLAIQSKAADGSIINIEIYNYEKKN